MNNKESQLIIKEIINKPALLSIIPLEVLLLKFLTLTKHNDIRTFILRNKKIKVPIGYISKILKTGNLNFIHLFKIRNNYYINNDYYDYHINNNEIKTLITSQINSKETIFNYNLNLIVSNPDYLIVQYENSEPIETTMIKYLLSKDDMENVFNLKTYDKNNIQNLNGNYYKLNVIVTNDFKIYFNSKGKQYLYHNGILIEKDWDIFVDPKPLLSIYSKSNVKSIPSLSKSSTFSLSSS